MRRFAMAMVLLCGLTIFWCWSRASVAAGSADASTSFLRNIHIGDHVRLCLQHGTSTADYVEGTLSGFDGSSFEVSGETRALCSNDKNVVGMEDRKTISIVPLTSVAFVEKTVSEQFVPSTQP
jgi:hypothetical protein